MAVSLCRKRILDYKRFLFHVQKRPGYVVLIPETPTEVADFNIISLENLPDFSQLSAKTCTNLLHQYAQQYDCGSWEIIEHLEQQLKKPEKIDIFKNVMEPLEVLTVPLLTTWGVIRTLYVANRSLMTLRKFIPLNEKIVQTRNERFDRKSIYVACKKYLEENNEKCTEEQKRVLKKFIWEGFHNGFELDDKKREKLKKGYETLELWRKRYEVKYLNSLNLFKEVIYEGSFNKEAPIDLLRNAAVKKKNFEAGPWVISLKDSVYWRYMEYCSSRESRYKAWMFYNQVASNFLSISCNATNDILNIKVKKQEIAEILGFSSYVHLSMPTKMAGSVEKVQMVLSELLESAKLGQEREVFELEKFAFENGFTGILELWDLPFYERKFLEQKLNMTENKLREYFPVGQVLLGLIALCEQLFGIEIQEQKAIDCWGPSVRYFRISDEKTKTILGGFYFDPYASDEKLAGEKDNGWFVPIRPRSKIIASLPLSSLIFNFTPPTEDTPSLLYYKEVENLFERFGQMIQFTLTEANYSEVSGLSNIEWDAVEICSNFFKFWLSEKGTLESISGHYKTGEPLPSHTLEVLCNIHQFMAGTHLSREIYFSNLDLYLHLRPNHNSTAVVSELWPQHFLFTLHKNDAHVFGFKDVFLTPFGSSVYKQVWSKMAAADIFYAFVEAGLSNLEEVSALGIKFRSTFLSLGGSCGAGQVFRRFRGREPDPQFLISLLDLPVATYFEPSAEPHLALPPSDTKNT